jgi:uncharacterized membrane-anchored protein YhcB (DUF1043 family)
MIKFFRRIRQRLLSENNFSKYLIYAIGEIVLVVIGILIALQINNWNQRRLEHSKEQIYLTNIKRDLQLQLQLIEAQLEREESYINETLPILDSYYKHREIIVDSTFTLYLSKVTERRTFIKTDPTYTDLISSGNIDILKDIAFKNKLIEYYQNLARIEKITQNNNIYLNDQIYFSEIIKLIYFDNGPMPEANELTDISNEILNKKENKLRLINLVNFRKHLAEGSRDLMLDTKSRTNELLALMPN